ncbi:hypothetical protein D3C81_1314700 [compost metagenome]
MAAQFGDQQAAARFHPFGQQAQGQGRVAEMVQDHVQHNAVGCHIRCIQCIGQLQVHIVQAFALADLAGQLEHGRAVVQRGDRAEAPCQVREEAAVTGADLQRTGSRAKIECVEQRQQAFAVLRQAGDQVLLGAEFFFHALEKVLAGGCATLLHQGDTCLHLGWQGQVIDFFEQRRVQAPTQAQAVGQGAAIENGVAFAARSHQLGLGQHLEVVAHAGLADVEDLRQFQHAKRVAGQRAQNIQTQLVTTGFAQGGQCVASLRDRLRTEVHGAAV